MRRRKHLGRATNSVRHVKDLWSQALAGPIVGKKISLPGASMRGRIEQAEAAVAVI